MMRSDLVSLELQAEVDSLLEEFAQWAESAPQWEPSRTCRAMLRRVAERTEAIRSKLESPLVVALLGGTGSGKSTLINALLGADVVQTGRQRPTTMRPTLICHSETTPEMLGIDPASVDLVQQNLPLLSHLVLVDCPDPDTTEEPNATNTNLGRLRELLPLCDVLLVTTTQQKYRSARVADELALAARGARIIFVQTHADEDQDIREDWRRTLDEQYQMGHIFLIDSLAARDKGQPDTAAQEEFSSLVALLAQQLAGPAAPRIRRSNILDLLAETLDACKKRLQTGLPELEKLQKSIEERRIALAGQLAQKMRKELLANRRQWENRLLGQIASQWGLSPWSLVLRIFQGLGGMFSGALLFRARTPAQLALWGTWQGARSWVKRRRSRRADTEVQRAAMGCWSSADLRSAALVLDGYAVQLGLDRTATRTETIEREADEAASTFVTSVSDELEILIQKQAEHHTGWFTRWRYELLLGTMLGWLIYRLGRNFFYDSLIDSNQIFGLDFYLQSAFWLLLWCSILLWAFTSRLRQGLQRQINQLAQQWTTPEPTRPIFAQIEGECRKIIRFDQELQRLERHVETLRQQHTLPDDQLGRCK